MKHMSQRIHVRHYSSMFINVHLPNKVHLNPRLTLTLPPTSPPTTTDPSTPHDQDPSTMEEDAKK